MQGMKNVQCDLNIRAWLSIKFTLENRIH